MVAAVSAPPSFFARLALAFRVLGDAELAARLTAPPALPEAPALAAAPAPPPAPIAAPPADDRSALVLLALLQREGRLVDFLEEDVAAFSDADVGAAARAVHEGCRKALREHLPVVPVRDEAEGAAVTLAAGFDAASHTLVGNAAGPPYRGVVRHRGWRVSELRLPTLITGADARIVAPAEIEA